MVKEQDAMTNVAVSAHVVRAVSKRDTIEEVFQPTERQAAYRLACLDPSIRPTISARATAAGVSRQRVHIWLLNPDFRAWLSTERRLAFEHRIADVKEKAVEMALRGSAEHIRIVLELAGELGRGRGGEDGGPKNAVQVIIGVPRPPKTE